MKSIPRMLFFGLLAGALVALPLQTNAQSTNAAAAKSAAAETKKKPGPHPFHGKLAAVDKMAKTITVGKSTYQITSETRIKKAGKPATLADGVVGEEVSGFVRPTEDGKLVAASVTFGPRPATKGAEKKADDAQKQ